MVYFEQLKDAQEQSDIILDTRGIVAVDRLPDFSFSPGQFENGIKHAKEM